MMLSNGKVAKMPDKKLNDNEIIKIKKRLKDIVEENEFEYFHSNNMGWYAEIRLAYMAIKHLQAENERLKPFEDKFSEFKVHIRVEDMLVCASSLGEWLEFCDNLKAEAYNEFAEWLYSLFPTPNSEIVVISRTGIAKKVNELLDKRSD